MHQPLCCSINWEEWKKDYRARLGLDLITPEPESQAEALVRLSSPAPEDRMGEDVIANVEMEDLEVEGSLPQPNSPPTVVYSEPFYPFTSDIPSDPQYGQRSEAPSPPSQPFVLGLLSEPAADEDPFI